MRIKTKILLLTISTLISILFISTYYTHKAAEKTHENALRDEASKIARQIESYMPQGAKQADPLEIDEHFDELLFLSPHLVRVDAYTLNAGDQLKRVVSKYKLPVELPGITPEDLKAALRGELLLSFEQSAEHSYVNVTAPLRYEGLVFGIAGFKVSQDEFHELLSNKRKVTILVAGIALFAIAGVLVLSMDRLVSTPIQNLLKAINRVKDGDLNATVEPAASDEIGALSKHFNEMLSTIRKDSAEKEELLRQINRHNDELKQKVDLATLELLQRNEALRRANQSISDIQRKLGHSRRLAAVGQISATVAHELGTPLHSVMGHLQLLMEEPDLSADASRRLKIMLSQLERITASIQNLLDTTRPPDAMGSLDINKIIEEAALLMHPEALSKQITVTRNLQQGLATVYGSNMKLQEVFLNIMDNAMDACAQGGAIEITTGMLEGDGAQKGRYVTATIKDNGRGIPAEHLGCIFTPFYTTKAYGQGTGLGLAISHETIQTHHGRITVESRVDKGSAFTIYLPAEPEEKK